MKTQLFIQTKRHALFHNVFSFTGNIYFYPLTTTKTHSKLAISQGKTENSIRVVCHPFLVFISLFQCFEKLVKV